MNIIRFRGWEIDPSVNWQQLCFGGWKDGRSWLLYFGPFSLIIEAPEGSESRRIVEDGMKRMFEKCPLCGSLVTRAPQDPP